jgi:hypothetical protein
MKQLLSALWTRLRHFRSDADLADELRSHFEMLAEDEVAPGISIEEAQRRARLRLGKQGAVVERIRDQELATFLEGWYRDLVIGLRALRKSPVFCLTAVLTLALGIGANTAIFTLLYGLVLRRTATLRSFCNPFLKHSHDLLIHEQFDIPAVIAGIDVYLLLVIHAITPLMNLNNNRDRNVIWCLRGVL